MRTVSDEITQILTALPDYFTTADAEEVAEKHGVAKRTINRYLASLVDAELLVKIKFGHYAKPESVTQDTASKTPEAEEKQSGIEMDVNMEEGTATFKTEASFHPRTPEEIVEVLKIDTEVWRLDRYWNKEKFDGRWLISALVSRKQKRPSDLLAEVVERFNPVPITKIPEPIINLDFTEPVAGVISLQDIHYGKENNEGISERFKSCLQELMLKAYHSHNLDTLYFVLGGDLLNMDTFSGTTTSGTPVSNGLTATAAYDKAFEDMYQAIGFMKQFCKKLVIVYIPGNHDRLSSYHLVHALSKCYNVPEIRFDYVYEERKVHTYGSNFLGFEHGDVKSKNPVALYATEFPTKWGATVHRVVFTGHTHTKKTREVITENEIHGLSIKELPSLAATDYWHYHNKYTGNKKAGVIELFSKTKGKVSEFFHIAS